MASKVTAYSSPKNIGGRTSDAEERIFVLNDIWNTSELDETGLKNWSKHEEASEPRKDGPPMRDGHQRARGAWV